MLRGADRKVLTEVKSIINFSILVAYHLRLEVAYYTDRFATLPSVNENLEFNDESDDDLVSINDQVIDQYHLRFTKKLSPDIRAKLNSSSKFV